MLARKYSCPFNSGAGGPQIWTLSDDLSSDFLKMDIEYSEFESMSSLAAAFPKSEGLDLPVGQLMVEIHLFGYNDINPESFLKW
jgi:hypothetical protein